MTTILEGFSDARFMSRAWFGGRLLEIVWYSERFIVLAKLGRMF